jgi:hypothetical protein
LKVSRRKNIELVSHRKIFDWADNYLDKAEKPRQGKKYISTEKNRLGIKVPLKKKQM